MWLSLFFVLTVAIYVNTFNASWHLDDYPNIVNNPAVQLDTLSVEALGRALYGHPAQPLRLSRPVAYLSFAANWYLGKDAVAGYHLVNILIHFLTAAFLLGAIQAILQTVTFRDLPAAERDFIALLGTVLWLVNPVHTQAVTYIVQRMAGLAALFTIGALFFYVRGRLAPAGRRRALFFFACGLAAALGVGSKENAAMLPFALILVELCFFRNATPLWRQAGSRSLWAAVGVGVVLVAILVSWKGHLLFFVDGYGGRGFTLTERLLTQPRVLLLYLSQLAYPVPQRLSIDHNVTVSTSLLEPWSTLPAMLAVIGLVVAGFVFRRRYPLAAFGILFYFLNHLVESTVIPLEMAFEHRNYLPSLFLFFPVAAGLYRLLQHYRASRLMRSFVIAFTVLMVAGLGMGTYIRNMAWASERTLWQDALAKAPDSSRSAYNLAKYHFKPAGDDVRALALYQRAYLADGPSPKISKALALNGAAGIYYRRGDDEAVEELCRQALGIYPGFAEARYNLLLVSLKQQRWEAAAVLADQLVGRHPQDLFYRYLQGVVFLHQQRPGPALDCFRAVLARRPEDLKALLGLAQAFSQSGNHRRAAWFERRALERYPDDPAAVLYAIQNRVRAGDRLAAEAHARHLAARFPLSIVRAALRGDNHAPFAIPLDTATIRPVLAGGLAQQCH